MRADFDRFARRSTPSLLRVGYLLTGNRQDAEDLAQEALFNVYRHWRRVRKLENPEGYVHKTLVNAFLTRRRRRLPETVSLESAGEPPSRGDLQEQVADRDRVARALLQLPHKERVAVVLRHFRQFSHAEIASVMGTKESTARSTVSRGHAQLRKSLGHDPADQLGRK